MTERDDGWTPTEWFDRMVMPGAVLGAIGVLYGLYCLSRWLISLLGGG